MESSSEEVKAELTCVNSTRWVRINSSRKKKKQKTGTWARGQMLQMFQVKKIFLSVFSVKIHRERGYNQSAVCVRESLDLRSGFVDSDKPLIAVWILNL